MAPGSMSHCALQVEPEPSETEIMRRLPMPELIAACRRAKTHPVQDESLRNWSLDKKL